MTLMRLRSFFLKQKYDTEVFHKHSLESGPADLFEGHDVCEEKTEDGYVHAKSYDLSTTSSVSLRMNLETDG